MQTVTEKQEKGQLEFIYQNTLNKFIFVTS